MGCWSRKFVSWKTFWPPQEVPVKGGKKGGREEERKEEMEKERNRKRLSRGERRRRREKEKKGAGERERDWRGKGSGGRGPTCWRKLKHSDVRWLRGHPAVGLLHSQSSWECLGAPDPAVTNRQALWEALWGKETSSILLPAKKNVASGKKQRWTQHN